MCDNFSEVKNKMTETAWDIDEVKRLKKIQLVQGNTMMLLFFVSFPYVVMSENTFVLLGLYCVILWIFVASILYTLKTGKTFGTKTSRRVQAFDKDHLGEKRWKRRKVIEAVIISISTIVLTVLLCVFDFNDVRSDYSNYAFPFIGSWIGYNIGEIVRMNKL